MKNRIIIGVVALAAVLVVGCANNPQGETSSSSVESSTSSTDIFSNSEDSFDPIKQQEETTSSSSSDTSSSESTIDINEPTSSSSGNTSTPNSLYWTPDAAENTPGPYGGYYDASGNLHAIEANIPLDSYGYPVVTFYAEDGSLNMSKVDKEVYDAETQRILQGGGQDAFEGGEYDLYQWLF